MCNYGYCKHYCKTFRPTSTVIAIYIYPDPEIKDFSSFSDNNMDLRRVELLTSSLQMKRSSQLNYRPVIILVGTPRIELGTSVLSGLRSNQLSYAPLIGTYI